MALVAAPHYNRSCPLWELDQWLIRDLSRIVEEYLGLLPHHKTLIKRVTMSTVRQAIHHTGWDCETYFSLCQVIPCQQTCCCFSQVQLACDRITSDQFSTWPSRLFVMTLQLVRVSKSSSLVSRNCFAIDSEWLVPKSVYHSGPEYCIPWRFLIRKTCHETRQQFRTRTGICPWDYDAIRISHTIAPLLYFHRDLAKLLLHQLPRHS